MKHVNALSIEFFFSRAKMLESFLSKISMSKAIAAIAFNNCWICDIERFHSYS